MTSSPASDCPVFVPYDKPVSTWRTLSIGLSSAERDYVKFYLGLSLVERYEEIEGEIDSLLDIWRDYRNETIAHCTDPTLPRLAEPPVVRQRLTTEIDFFVKHIQEQCANNDQIFHRRLSSGHNWNAINYALVTSTGDDERCIRERPVSARDRQGRETPALLIPEPATNKDDTPAIQPLQPTAASTIDVDTVRTKLEDFTFDDITQRLRQSITDDIRMLEQHIVYLHQKLEEEADYRAKTRGLLREPTLGELKDERNRLEKEVFNTSHTSDASVSYTSSPSTLSHSPRTSLDATAVVATTRPKGPLRALPTDPSATHKPRLSIDRKAPPTAKSTTPVLLRLGSIKQKDLLNYPSESTAAARINSADRFRRMVLDCRDVTS